MPRGNDPSGNQEARNNQDKIQTIRESSSLTEIDKQQMNDDQMMIYNTMGKNDDNSISVDDDKCSFPSSPIFHEIDRDWSHLIDSVLSNDDINTTFLTTTGTVNNENICVSMSSEPVVPINFTTEDPIPDVKSLSNVQVSPMEIESDSVVSKAASAAMSTDIFANLSSDMEHSGCGYKIRPDASEQDRVINKNMQSPTEDEIVEIGKSFSQTLNIVSTDSTSESSPDIILTQKTFSTCKNNDKYKKMGKNKLRNKHEKVRFKSQFLLSDTRESKTKEFKGKKMKFPKAGKFHNGCRKKIINQEKHTSEAERPQERIHGFRKQTGKGRVNFRSRQVNLKA
jgi:hypothetical protein